MFKLIIICLGKFKESAYKDLEKEYLKRLSPFAKTKIIELDEIGYRSKDQIEKTKLQEADIIRKHLPKDAIIILLEEKGTLRNSKDFATFLNRVTSLGQEIVFVIGSGVGLDASLKSNSNYQISLSPLTFPHNMARIILEEQIYRAYMINSGREYHK